MAELERLDEFVTKGRLTSVGGFHASYQTEVTGTHGEWLRSRGFNKDNFGLPKPIFDALGGPEFIEIVVRRDSELT